jgi:hypothetical protein
MTERTPKKPAVSAKKKKPASTAPAPESLLADEVRRPNLDVGVYLAWARALAATAQEHRAALIATPMTPEADLTAAEIKDFERAVTRLSDVQDEQERRLEATANLTPTQRKNYAAARAAQKTAVDAIRHAYRDDRAVRSWCAQVLLGTGVADLHDDARKLTAFWDERAEHLARFTAGRAALEQMTLLASQLPDISTPDAESDKRHTRLRNAAWTLVDRAAARICTAGRFAFRADRDERKRFRRAPEKRRRKGAKPA